MLVALTGGTGFVGRFIIEKLIRRDHDVRVLARHPARATWMRGRGVEVVEGGLDSDAALRQLLAGAGAVVHLVGIIEQLGRQTFERVHVQGTRAMILAAREAGVQRFVHMSALGARAEPGATAYHRTKAAAEELVRAGGFSHAILRPSIVAAPGNAALALMVRMLRFAPVVPVIGDGLYRLQPVDADDVAEAFALAVEQPAISGTFEIAGPEPLTYHQVLDALEAGLGVRRQRVRVPAGLVRLSAMVGTLVPMVNPISPAQLQMLLEGSTTDRNALPTVFGITPRAFGDAARAITAPYAPRKPAKP